MSDVYMDCEYTDYDVKHSSDPIPTYDKNRAEKEIALLEKITKKKLTDKQKEKIRKGYKVIEE